MKNICTSFLFMEMYYLIYHIIFSGIFPCNFYFVRASSFIHNAKYLKASFSQCVSCVLNVLTSGAKWSHLDFHSNCVYAKWLLRKSNELRNIKPCFFCSKKCWGRLKMSPFDPSSWIKCDTAIVVRLWADCCHQLI